MTTEAYAQASGPVDGIQSFYFTQGVLGVSCFVLGLVIWKLWSELKAERKEHKEELEAKDQLIESKDKLIEKLHGDILTEARVGFDIAKSNGSVLEGILASMRKGG